MKRLKILVAFIVAVFILATPQMLYAGPVTDTAVADESPGIVNDGETSTPIVFINSEPAEFSVPPVIQKETVLVPALDLAPLLSLGLTVDSENNTLHFFGNAGELILPVGDKFAYLNGKQKELVCPAQLIGDTVYAPLLFVTHSMGSEVTWDKNNLTAFVRLPEIKSRGNLSVNVIDKNTGMTIPKALVAILETNEISCVNEIGGCKNFLLDITNDFSGNCFCIKPPDEIYGLYTLYVTAENYQPAIYRHIPVCGNDEVQITVKLNKCNLADASDTLEIGDATEQVETLKNYYKNVYLEDIKRARIPMVGIGNLPSDDLIAWVEATKKGVGVFRKDTPDYSNYLICMGEKSTGGYHVKIENIACFPDKWIVDAIFSSPALDDIVTQAITYPKQTISIPQDNKPVIFRLYENGKYNYLPIGG